VKGGVFVRTQVAIIGAGPAGLMLSHLLAIQGIESVVLENRTRAYVERRVRAGVLEQGTVDLLRASGLSSRMDREGLIHHGIELRFEGRGHRIALSDLTRGRYVMIYGQTELVKDLIQSRLDSGGIILFEAECRSLENLRSSPAVVRYEREGEYHQLECDMVAGCDGFHGPSRQAIPGEVLRTYDREYPFGWLGILAAVPPSTDELIYAYSDRGFALHSLRSPEISRLYLQCDPGDSMEHWPDDRIWQELQLRFATQDGWRLQEGPILEKGITPMRSFVAEPMRYGRLFLAGDAAHIVPPTGAKGLNLAIGDVRILASALIAWFKAGRTDLLERYTDTCLRRVWRAQYFAGWMTMMLHVHSGADDLERRMQLAQLEYVCSSTAAATSLAENYVGFPLP
jgi:p-hydroxybenzoate 3-monooxygenase